MKKSPLSWIGVLSIFASACQSDAPTTAPFNETPVFAQGGNVKLQVAKSGAGTGRVTSSPSGINCGSTCSAQFAPGTVVTLTATPTSGSTFAGWSGGGCSGTGTCTLTLNSRTTVTATFNSSSCAPLTITTESLPDGNRGADYSAFLTSGGGCSGQDKWSLVSGSLPKGLTMAQFFGIMSTIISGTPTEEGTSTFTVKVEDDTQSATKTFSITINPPSNLVITLPGDTAQAGKVGQFYFQNLFASGGAPPYTWSVPPGQLPPGLQVIHADNGNRIEGTPTTAGTFTFTLTVTDEFGASTSQQTTIVISP